MTAGLFGGRHDVLPKRRVRKAIREVKASLASLNLTADQTTKINHLLIQYRVSYCTEDGAAQVMKDPKSILTPEQYAKFKECGIKGIL
jgi:hypothetical protein